MPKNGRIDPKFLPIMYLWGFYQFSKFRKKMTFLKKKSPTYPLHIPYKIPQKWTKMPRKWLKMVQLSPNFDTWCIWGVFINFQNFGKKGQKMEFFCQKNTQNMEKRKNPLQVAAKWHHWSKYSLYFRVYCSGPSNQILRKSAHFSAF